MPPDTDEKGWFLGSLWKTVSAFFEAGFGKVWDKYKEVMLSLIDSWVSLHTKTWGIIQNPLWDETIKRSKDYGWIDRQSEIELLKLKKLTFPFNMLAWMLVAGGMTLQSIKQTMYVAGSDLRRKMFAEGQPEDAQPGSILQAMFTDPNTLPQITEILRNEGLPPEQIDLMFTAMQRLYDESAIKDLFLRGIIDRVGLNKRMHQLGYKDDQIEEMVQAFPVIPGPGDLFHLVAKEAFEPDVVAHYGYGEEFPEEQIKWLKMQGISDYWAMRYWYAHWDTPSIGQGFEMLQRGVIDWDELNLLFRTVELPPFWRDKLTEIAFMPYTRVDVRRMHAIGTLTDDELIRAYQDVGFSPEKAVKMAEFTILYNKGAEKDLTREQVLNGYRDDFISKQDTHSLIMEMGYSATEADYFVSSVDFEKVKDIEKLQLENIRDKFQKNLIDEFDARTGLAALSLEGSRIEVLLEKWKINVIDNTRKPSKTDLDKFLKGKIITENIYVEQMRNLGYADKYIDWYTKAASIK